MAVGAIHRLTHLIDGTYRVAVARKPARKAAIAPLVGLVACAAARARLGAVRLALPLKRNTEGAPEIQFEDPERATVAVAAEQVVVVQRSAAGLETLLRIDRDGGWADQPLFDFAGRRGPAGYLLARGPLLTLLPYGAGGVDTGGVIGLDWSAGEAAFRLVAEQP